MSTPIHRVCRSVADLPSVAEITRLVDDDHHLVLRVDAESSGAGFDERLILERLAPQLPDHAVYDGGGVVSIARVIAEATVLAEADAIVAASSLYRSVATDLMNRLSRKLAIPLEAFYRLEHYPALRRGWFRERWRGRLDFRWRYGFHGRQCGFTNGSTGQDVEVELGFWQEFGVLDPYFFATFVNTTPGLGNVAALFRNNFNDPRRALDILERSGRLKKVADQATGRAGVAAPEA